MIVIPKDMQIFLHYCKFNTVSIPKFVLFHFTLFPFHLLIYVFFFVFQFMSIFFFFRQIQNTLNNLNENRLIIVYL